MLEIPIIKTIQLGPLTIQIWGLFVGLGILYAYWLARSRFKERKIALNHLDQMFLISVITALIGARLFWVIIEYDFYLKQPLEILKLWNGGLAFTGGFFAVLITMFLYLKKHSISFWKAADALAIPLAAGLLIGRFGCLFVGLHPGFQTDYGVTININGEPQLAWAFFSIINWGLALVVLRYIEKNKPKVKTLSYITLTWWGVWRLGGDFLRSNNVIEGGDPIYGFLTPTQYLALFVLVTTIVIYTKEQRLLKH